MMSKKTLDEITIEEWTRWEWIDITTAADELRTYTKGQQRTPEDAAAAFRTFREYQRTTKGAKI